jgi:queuine tRNA-ribosyltransferase
MIRFSVTRTDTGTSARVGVLETDRHVLDTPAFMPVATQATVKGLTPADLTENGVDIIVCNTYHLMLRPTAALIREMGGLHRFMGWNRAILTDSGGFQAYSLSALRKVNDDGIEFTSHLDGSKHFLDPERAVEIQDELGSDIAMILDFFTPYPAQLMEARMAVERTIGWAERSLTVKKNNHYSA